MAVKTFTTGEVLTAADTNTYLNNGGLVYITKKSFVSQATWDCTSVFSATYDNYFLIYESTSAPAGGAIVAGQLLNGSSPAAGANYAYYQSGNLWAGTVDNTAGGNTATSWFAIRSASFFFGCMNIYNPFLAQYTAFSGEGVDLNNSWQMRGIHALNTSYDGIRFSQAGNMTGSVTFYGYRKA